MKEGKGKSQGQEGEWLETTDRHNGRRKGGRADRETLRRTAKQQPNEPRNSTDKNSQNPLAKVFFTRFLSSMAAFTIVHGFCFTFNYAKSALPTVYNLKRILYGQSQIKSIPIPRIILILNCSY